jgi:hypothetical protein
MTLTYASRNRPHLSSLQQFGDNVTGGRAASILNDAHWSEG